MALATMFIVLNLIAGIKNNKGKKSGLSYANHGAE